MRRDYSAYAVLLVVLALFAFFAWMTRQPEAPLFVRAEGWPLVGETVARLRRSYLPPVETVSRPGDAPAIARESRSIYIGVGALIRERPEAAAAVLTKTRRLGSYQVVGHQGRWLEVRRLGAAPGFTGWYDPQAPRDRAPPLGEAPEPPRPVASRPAAKEQLAAARSEMGPRAWQGRLAGYRLVTDVASGPWLATLEKRVELAEHVYGARYGVTPIGRSRETVVLFSEESSYRRYEREVAGLGGSRSSGHASGGAVVLYRGDRSLEALASTLIHEIGHLLNRRALGPALPPWLDEGLADELAHFALPARFAADGDPFLGLRIEGETRVEYRGILASLQLLRKALAASRLIELAALTTLDAAAFSRGEASAQHYAHSALWLHSLLEDPLPRLRAEELRDYLRGIADGEPATAERLRAALRTSWDEIELAFRSFLIDEAARTGVWSPGGITG